MIRDYKQNTTNTGYHGYFFNFISPLFRGNWLDEANSQNVEASATQVLDGDYSCKFTASYSASKEAILATTNFDLEHHYTNILIFFSVYAELVPTTGTMIVQADFGQGAPQRVEVTLDKTDEWLTQKHAAFTIPSGAQHFSIKIMLSGIYHSSTEVNVYIDNLGIYAQSTAVDQRDNYAIFSDNDGVLAAHDMVTGTQQWQFDTAYGFLSAKPNVVDGIAYFGDGDTICNIYALHGKSGKKKWVTELSGSIDATPEVVGDTVYITSSTGKLFEIAKATGTQTAEYNILNLPAGQTAKIYSNQLVGRSIVMTTEKGVFGFDLTTKQINFNQTLNYAVDTVPSVHNGIIYYGDLEGYFYAIDFKTNQSLWRVSLDGPIHASPQIVGTLIIVGCDGGKLLALDMKTGDVVNQLTKPGHMIRSFKVASNRLYVAFNAIQGSVCAYEIKHDPTASPDTPLSGDDSVFNELWCFDVTLGVERDPLIIGNQVCFASNDHNCYCVDADTGKQLWNVVTPIAGYTEPSLVPLAPAQAPSRRYDQYCYLMSHNSFAFFTNGWWLGNQEMTLTEQLDYGVRGLMLDTHKEQVDGRDRIVLYHETKWSDVSWFYLQTAMREIGTWLTNNPSEVVTIQFQNRQRDPQLTARALSAAGVSDMIFDPSKTNTGSTGETWGPVLQNGWPTIDWMVRNNKRLVLFAEKNYDWIPYAWQYTVETWYGAKSLQGNYDERDESKEIPLSKNRSLYTVNLFPDLWYVLPLSGHLSYNSLNSFDSLMARADVCKWNPRFSTDPSLGWEFHLPNFLALDFVSRGNNGGPLRAVEELNKLWGL